MELKELITVAMRGIAITILLITFNKTVTKGKDKLTLKVSILLVVAYLIFLDSQICNYIREATELKIFNHCVITIILLINIMLLQIISSTYKYILSIQGIIYLFEHISKDSKLLSIAVTGKCYKITKVRKKENLICKQIEYLCYNIFNK